MELHGGTVEARSDGPGRGSEFVVRLPPDATAPADEAPRPHGKRRVLLVGGHRDGRDMLRELLELWGHEVETAPAAWSGFAPGRRTWP